VQADTLELQLPLSSTDTVLATLDLPGFGPVNLPPVCLPYSCEFEPAESQRTSSASEESPTGALAELALATGGRERTDVTTIWHDLPATRVYYPLRPWLLGLALLTLLLEILERRTGWLTAAGGRLHLATLTTRWQNLASTLTRIPRRLWAIVRRPGTLEAAPAKSGSVSAGGLVQPEPPGQPIRHRRLNPRLPAPRLLEPGQRFPIPPPRQLRRYFLRWNRLVGVHNGDFRQDKTVRIHPKMSRSFGLLSFKRKVGESGVGQNLSPWLVLMVIRKLDAGHAISPCPN
jgi:hypothetical protein